jgi:hypothetical protein
MSTNGLAWKRSCSFFSDIVKKERFSCTRLLQALKHGCTSLNLQANIKAWSGNMSLPKTKKFKSVLSAGSVMLTLFWDFNGPILEHYQDCGQMVNGAQCCTMLEEELKPAICSELRQYSV